MACLRQRFGVGDVDRGAGEMSRLQSGNQIVGNHKIAAAAVGKEGARFHRGEELGVRQTARLGRAGHKGRDDVSLGQALGEGVHAVHVLKHNGVDEWMALDAADVRAMLRQSVAKWPPISPAPSTSTLAFLSEVTGPKSSQRCSRCKS